MYIVTHACWGDKNVTAVFYFSLSIWPDIWHHFVLGRNKLRTSLLRLYKTSNQDSAPSSSTVLWCNLIGVKISQVSEVAVSFPLQQQQENLLPSKYSAIVSTITGRKNRKVSHKLFI